MLINNVQENDCFSILRKEEQAKLLEHYHQELDEKTRDKIILHNQKLILSFANKYSKLTGYEINDISQQANLKFLECLPTYDPNKGTLSTHLVKCITRALNRYTIKNKYMTEYFALMEVKYNKLIEEFQKQGKEIPSDEEICKTLKTSKETLEVIKSQIYDVMSYNQTESEDSKNEIIDNIADPNNSFESLEQKDEQTRKRQLLLVVKSLLSPKEYFILYYKGYCGVKINEIAKSIKISYTRVDRLYKDALIKIKEYLPMDESPIFYKRLEQIQQEYGTNYEKINEYPLNLDDIMKYLYFEPILEEKERIIYFEKYVLQNQFDDSYYQEKFRLTEEEYKKILQEIEEKMLIIYEEDTYKKWVQYFQETNKMTAFTVMEYMEAKCNLYSKWLKTYPNLSLDQILVTVQEQYQAKEIPNDIRGKKIVIERRLRKRKN